MKTLLRDSDLEQIRASILAGETLSQQAAADLLDETLNRRTMMEMWAKQMTSLKGRAAAAERKAAVAFKSAYRQFMSESKSETV